MRSTAPRALHRSSLLILLSCLGLSQSAWASEPAPDPDTARYEVRFLTNMIDHHAMAVMMAEMCLERAAHRELITLCSDIILNQSAEIETMQTWLQDWYGLAHEPDTSAPSMQRLLRLEGAEFEIAFMEMMIRHHSRAVREASHCVERAYHADLLALCSQIVAMQLEEIRTMRSWLCEWYGICRPRDTDGT